MAKTGEFYLIEQTHLLGEDGTVMNIEVDADSPRAAVVHVLNTTEDSYVIRCAKRIGEDDMWMFDPRFSLYSMAIEEGEEYELETEFSELPALRFTKIVGAELTALQLQYA